ncbi:MAG: type IV secretion system DNA-binding domain-containing protein [Tepidimonas taiwanensis]|nr:type IV secretion system DNA-binding domain-containing protein [Tepidimonas taiwanensis]
MTPLLVRAGRLRARARLALVGALVCAVLTPALALAVRGVSAAELGTAAGLVARERTAAAGAALRESVRAAFSRKPAAEPAPAPSPEDEAIMADLERRLLGDAEPAPAPQKGSKGEKKRAKATPTPAETRAQALAEAEALLRDTARYAGIGALLGLVAGLLVPLGRPEDVAQQAAATLRGAELVDARKLQKLTKKSGAGIAIANIPIPANLETLHFLISGSTGAGKTVAIHEILDGAASRGDRALIADIGGLALEKYFDESRGDIIINPLDARSVEWSPLAEMRAAHDAERIARAIVPEGHGSGKEWNAYARTFVASVFEYAFKNQLNNEKLTELLLFSQNSELRKLFAAYPIRAMLDESNDKMLAGVRGIVSTYCAPFRLLHPDADARAFSIRRIAEDNSKRWIYLTARDDQIQALRTLISAMIDICTVGILSRNPGDARFWLVLDELATFGQVSGLADFLTKSRKYGGRAIVGIQSTAQLRDIYGRDGAQTLLSCLSNALILRTVDAETSEELSRLIGERQIYRENLSQSEASRGHLSQTRSVQLRLEKERAILPSQIQNLPDRTGYLSLAGDFPVARVSLEIRQRPSRAQSYLPANRDAIAPRAVAEQSQPPSQPASRDVGADFGG